MIALSQEKYDEIQNRISNYAKLKEEVIKKGHTHRKSAISGAKAILEEILSEAVILPVVNWGDTVQTLYTECANIDKFPDGVIIKTK